ncbi:caspase family protein [Streptomyces sp. NBC_00366]|uniref:caspase family protein n=1 Tax=Streptomyces sp. NBC_00366 TaxID=2975727 RepID=UPI002E25BDAA
MSHPLYHQANVKGPGVHALIIGVGGYPHLPGGDGERVDDPYRYGLTQLTSPPRSALRMAEMLKSHPYGSWALPLRSIDLLMSYAPNTSLTEEIEDLRSNGKVRNPTIQIIKTAFKEWMDRCVDDPDNIALFYFCGHGLQDIDHVLLASDFGRSSLTPFDGAFSFELTQKACQQRLPKTQIFIIDSCRRDAPDLANTLHSGINGLAVPTRGQAPQCTDLLTLQIPIFREAESLPERVSYMTSAVVSALEGQAATTDERGRWVVTLDTISAKIEHILKENMLRIQEEEPGLEFPPDVVNREVMGHGAVLCRLEKAPYAQLVVSCEPQSATAEADLACSRTPPPKEKALRRPADGNGEWPLKLAGGDYKLSATFHGGPWKKGEAQIFLEPPLRRLHIEVGR